MPNEPKPASPPYQPEIPAEAIHYAAHHRRKEIRVGWPTIEAIWGDRLASPLLDRYLAATGFAGQQDKEAVSPGRSDNLYEPVPGDRDRLTCAGDSPSAPRSRTCASCTIWQTRDSVTPSTLPMAACVRFSA